MSGEMRATPGCFAGGRDGDFAVAVEVEHADGVGAGVGDVGALAVGGDIDRIGAGDGRRWCAVTLFCVASMTETESLPVLTA